MKVLTLQRFGIVSESFFPKPIPYSDLLVQQVASKAIDKFRSAGLLPSGVASNPGDRVYGHSLFFAALSGKCSFRMTSDKIEVKCIDAVSQAEYGAFVQFVIDCAEIAQLGNEVSSHFQTYVHATFQSASDRQEMLGRLASLPEGVSAGGYVVYSQSAGWKHELRMQVDRSVAIPEALFILVGTRIDGLINKENLTTIYRSFEELAAKMGFKVEAEKHEQQSTT